MSNKIYKGLRFELKNIYNSLSDDQKKGILWFVRESNDDTKGDIYFGTRHYGSSRGNALNEEDINSILANYVTNEVVEQMIKNATQRIDGGIINSQPTDEPEEPITEAIGEIGENNEIIINEELLSPGTYTLKYIDGNDNPIDNFKPINEFTI